ncbi:unnamed protein product [Closterium sp. NIES-64]|nr:unnamed protein product [Closterium sp. NIES-64]
MEADPRTTGGKEAEPSKDWELGAGIGEQVAAAIQEVLRQHRNTFAYNLSELGRYKGRELELNLTTELPTYQRRRRMNAEDAAICKEKCEELLAAGIIRPSESSYAAATVVAARKDITGKVLAKRMCGDFRELNKITSPDRYPMPTAEDIFDRLEGAIIFTTLDLRQGFNQIAIREEDKRKTAFHGVDGLYEYNVMPFGIRNAPAVFQRAMDQVLKGIPAAACYIDDILIFSSSEEQHVQDLKRTLEAIASAGLTCHPDKCKVARQTVAYLGFEVKGGRLAIQEAKVKVLENLAAPKDKTGLRALLGFLNYYRKFVPNFSRRAYVLNQLLKEGRSWQWGELEETARQDLLEAVRTGTLLQIPRADAPFILYTDWSSTGMGAVLCQEIEGEERVVAFASRSCSPSEANYCSYEGEGLTAVWGITHFKVYLQGRHFTLVTDHQPLLWLMTHQELTGRNARWAIKLLGFDFEIRHRPGKTLQHADGLSRNPPPLQPVAQLAAMAQVAAVTWGQEKGKKRLGDIWEDEETMSWIKGEPLEEGGVSERARARGQHFRWFQEQLQLRTNEGWKVVPQPQERARIMGNVHAKLGHYGITRTRQLLSTMYWWASMGKDVAGLVASCEACQRNKARLEKERDELHSLPIHGLGYRWSLDLAGELPLSKGGKQYILVMVEHTSKWVEVRALPSKNSALIADAFEELVLTRYGACGEVLTDQGTEFQGSFDELLEEMGITHRVTSRFAKQAALKNLSPYHLLFGRDPVLPVDAPKLLSAVIEADEPNLWAELAYKRAKYLKELTPAALDNLHVAQLRDARRYQQRKASGVGGREDKVEAGQEVYLRKAKRDTLDLAVGSERWKVKEIRGSGVLVLEDIRGGTIKEHITNVARAGQGKPQALGPVARAAKMSAETREGAGKPEIPGGLQDRVITYTRRKKG